MQRAPSDFAKQNDKLVFDVERWTLSAWFLMIKAIFFDAVGTLFYLTRTVGHHYALVGREVGLILDAPQFDCIVSYRKYPMTHRAAILGPRENDDKGWWRELVD